MDYEKLYKEALVKATREYYCAQTENTKDVIKNIFPEFVESEDEKMFDMCMKALDAPDARSCIESWGVNPDDVKKWLEKQKPEYGEIWLPHVVDRKAIDDYAYQCAYDLSNDWAKDNPTWKDVQTACKLGIQWCEKHQKPTEWSEEDDKMIGGIRSIIEKYAFSQSAVDVNGDLCEQEYIAADDWIKHLKDRCISEQKQEWSDEDTKMLAKILFCLSSQVFPSIRERDEFINWLKSLKPNH